MTSPTIRHAFLCHVKGSKAAMKQGFQRIDRLPPYVFAEVTALRLEARHQGEDIIDFGMGNPDMPTPKPIVDKLIEKWDLGC